MKGKVRWFSLAASFLSALQLLSAEVTLKLSPPEFFEAYSFKAIAGTPGKNGHLDGVGTNALFGGTTGLATDTNGNVYVADPLLGGQTIRRIAPDGTVTTLAGRAGQAAEVDGKGSEARFHQPEAVVVGSDGNLFVADSYGETIRKVTPEGEVNTLAGRALTEGSVDGKGADARFKYPTGITIDPAGNLYVADQFNHTIRKVTALGEVTTIAGRPLAEGTNDGVGNAARFRYPRALTMARDGNLYVADLGSGTIRKVTTNGVTVTLAGAPILTQPYEPGDGVGSAARFGLVTGIASDSLNNLYVVDAYKHTVRKISPEGVVTTLDDVMGQRLLFKFGGDDSAIAIDQQDNIYVGDAEDGTILKANPSPRWLTIYLSAITTEPFYSSGLATAEASTDLKTWVPITTNVVYSGYESARIVDADAQSFPNRFYRARKQF
jgi:hypothetical protein